MGAIPKDSQIGLNPQQLKDKLGIELTEEQKTAIINLWNSQTNPPPTLQQLVDAAYPGRKVDPRKPEGMLVRSFLSNRKLKPRLANDYVKKERIEFSQEQKDRIIKLAPTMRPYEIGRILFNDPTLEPASVKVKSIIEYLDSLPASLKAEIGRLEDEVKEEYLPPKSIPGVLPKVNKYANPSEKYEQDKLLPRQKKELNTLLGYLQATRFLYQINSYTKQADRMLFESSIIRWTYDKPDLTQEDLDQYIMLAMNLVNSHKIEKQIRMFDNEQETMVQNGERLSMTLVEAISSARKELKDCETMQNKIFQNLTEKRSERLSNQIKENASILNLVSIWKEEESRKQLLYLAEKEKEILRDEIRNYMTMDELIFKVAGIGEEELLGG